MENPKKPLGFNKAQQKAEKIFDKTEKVSSLLEDAAEKVRHNRSRLKDLWNEIEILIQMVRAYRSGQYRKIPWKGITIALAALIYFVNPFDLIPDFILGLGFLDDAAVIGFVINALHNEIEKFKEQTHKEAERTNSGDSTNGAITANTSIS